MIGMVKLLALAALLVAGCEASLSPGNGNGGTDANGSGSGSNDIDASMQMQPDAAPACANGRKLFLNFDGVTLTDAASSDATTNTARWLTNASATIPPWRNGSGTRATEILQVTDGVKARLGVTSPIEVVTTRPATGPYVMIVLGGANTNNGGTVSTVYSYATSFHDCGDTIKNDVGWISDMNAAATNLANDAPTAYVADLVMGSVGWGLGLDGTTDPNGCMCGWTTACTDSANACTLSTSIASAITNPGAGETACPNQNPQNEVAAFTTGFCN